MLWSCAPPFLNFVSACQAVWFVSMGDRARLSAPPAKDGPMAPWARDAQRAHDHLAALLEHQDASQDAIHLPPDVAVRLADVLLATLNRVAAPWPHVTSSSVLSLEDAVRVADYLAGGARVRSPMRLRTTLVHRLLGFLAVAIAGATSAAQSPGETVGATVPQRRAG